MIFKWGDASNITLSSSFDNFSFHGDATFPTTVQSMQMHIAVKNMWRKYKAPIVNLMKAAGEMRVSYRKTAEPGAEMLFKVQRATSLTPNNATVQAQDTKLTDINTFL